MAKITPDEANMMSRQELREAIHVRSKEHENGHCGAERRNELRQEMAILENALMDVDNRPDEPPPVQPNKPFVI